MKWNLPPGWKVGEIQWPIPLILKEPGDIQIYGYHDEVLLLQEITPPASLTESTIKLSADANWLVCEKICIPGSAKLQIELPVAEALGQDAHDGPLERPRAVQPPVDEGAGRQLRDELRQGLLHRREQLQQVAEARDRVVRRQELREDVPAAYRSGEDDSVLGRGAGQLGE